MKPIPFLLVGGLLAVGTACSSTSTDRNPGTPNAGGENGLYSSAGSTAAGTSNTGAGPAGAANGTGGASDAGNTGTSRSGDTTDVTAFMGTFATMADPAFLMTAASSNLLEIRAGQMASQKASNPEVRRFAQMMVSHHMSTSQELKAIAVPMSTSLPQTMMPVHQAMADRLMDKTGKNFDEAYMDIMETAHKLDVAMFEVKSNAAESASVKAFATKTLPMLRSHHDMADALEKKVD
jgi:putative membrane protein